MMKLETLATPVFDESVGTYDSAPAAKQMETIDRAMMLYFDTADWLAERHRQRPGVEKPC